MLIQLQVSLFTETSCKELIQQTEIALEVSHTRSVHNKTLLIQFFCKQVVTEKFIQKNLTKFSSQLKDQLAKHTSAPMETVVEEDENTETIVNQTQSLRLEDKADESKQKSKKVNTSTSVKRRRRKSQKSVESNTTNDTILHTIIDNSLEVG